MDFQELLAKVAALDTPVAETTVEAPVAECPADMPTVGGPVDATEPAPSMSVNLNAQGLDNIADLIKLIAKAEEETAEIPAATVAVGDPLGAMTPDLPVPAAPTTDLDVPEVPDLDDAPAADADGVSIAQGDLDNDGDHDMADHDMEKDDEESDDEEQKEWANEPEEETKDTEYMVNKLAGGINRPKTMYQHSYRQGDNPMAMEGEELRAWIKNELSQRLAEVKGAK